MARINAYPYDTNVTDIDAWIGTDSVTRQTKQFTAAALANYLNIKGKISIGGQMNYRFIDTPSTTTGTFAFAAGGGDQTSWANITSIVISTSDLSNQVVTPFLAYLVDEQILFQDVAAKSSFGHYIIRGYTQLGSSSFYTLTLEYIGGNGNITTDNYYTLVNFYLEQGASGVTSVDSSNTTFIDMTPTTPTSGNVELTASLSATGTPGSTNFLRGDNTWAIVGTDIVEGTGTTNFVAKWLNTDTIGDSVIFDSGSFVGIGTNTPSKILQVGDGTGLDDTIRVVYNDGEYTDIHGYGLEMSRTASYIRPVTNGTGNLNIGENLKSWNSVIQNADTHIFSKDTSEWMRIDNDGEVLIGTTTPSGARLLVDHNNTKMLELKRNGNIKARFIADSNQGQLDLYNSASVNTIRLLASGDSYLNGGNVGIGTTSPDSLLEIASDSVTDFLKLTSTGGGATPIKLIFEKSTSEQGVIEYNRNGDLEIYNTDADGGVMIDGSASGGADLYVANTGNVGIGTTSPSAQLHSNASGSAINYGMFTIDTDNWINFFTGTGTAPGASAAGQGALFWKSGGVLRLGTSTSTAGAGFVDMVRIDTDGNVGIGTTSPTGVLDVLSSDAQRYARFRAPNGEERFEFFIGGTGNSAGLSMFDFTGTNRTVYIQAGGNSYFNGGNVGIGTTSPSSKLEVQDGSLTVDNGNIDVFSGGISVTRNSANNTGLTINQQGAADILNLKDNGVEVFTVIDGGNVGIGTTSPLAKLDISSTTDGVLLPRMTTAQVNAISSPENGLTVYNTTLNTLCFYNGSSWQKVTSANM
tara:strand:+ start:1413 stop:3833 length:2421 start_codon:yes stop_codon:yes gene_type:complete